MIARIGAWCYHNRRATAVAWIVGAILIVGISGAVGPDYNGEFSAPDSESTDGFESLQRNFPEQGATINRGSIVFRAEQGVDDPEVVAAMNELFALAAETDGINVVSPYTPFGAQQISPDGKTAFASVNVALSIDQTASGLVGEELFASRPEIDGLEVEIGGIVLSVFEPPETELIGVAFAVVVLILAFGSVLAMGLPIGVAVAGVLVGSALVSLISNAKLMPDFTPFIGVMIGLGVGIDYALFIVTRYREAHHRGLARHQAIFEAMDTAGRAVLFAGITVVVSLLGMLFVGLPFVSGIGVGAAATVFATLIAALTLLPAMIGFAGDRVELTRWRGLIAAGLFAIALLLLGLGIAPLAAVSAVLAVAVLALGRVIKPLAAEVPRLRQKPLRETFWYRWSRTLQARPWTALLAGTAILVVLALPLLGIRLAFSDEGNFPEDTTTRAAYDLLADGFGLGFNGPMLIAVEADSPEAAQQVDALRTALLATDGVAAVTPPFPSSVDPQAFLLQLIPETAPQDETTEQLVRTIRDDVVPAAVGDDLRVMVTGSVPAGIDFSSFLAGRTLFFFAAVLLISFLLLMAVFRSILVPIKAVLMNTLSIAAAYGVIVALFQWGWLGGITGIEPAPVEPWIPMMLFAIVFGLSMDYEVFLLSRIKEEYEKTGDAVNSVADGLATTARVISAAAAIMVVVFGSFLLEADRSVKLMGTGLAVAVLLDATFVRMLLVPATMELLGERNWWLPKWLDKILPELNVEGTGTVPGVIDLNTSESIRVKEPVEHKGRRLKTPRHAAK